MPATIINRNFLQAEYALGPKVVIRNIKRNDFGKLRELLEKENDGSLFVSAEELEAGWSLCPKGFFVATNGKDEIVSFCGAVILDDQQAVLSGYYTRIQDRGKGVGSKVYTAAKTAVGKRNLGANFYEKNTTLGSKLGFNVRSFELLDFCVSAPQIVMEVAPSGVEICRAEDESFAALVKYDKRHSPVLRSGFLRSMLAGCAHAYVAKKDSQIVGFGCLKRRSDNYRLMPLYADEPEVAVLLWQRLVSMVPHQSQIEFAMPVNNPHQEAFLSSVGLKAGDGDRVTRMYTRADLKLNTEGVYSITNFDSRLV